MGKPASMMSTPSLARFLAMSSFSLLVRVAPEGTGGRGGRGARLSAIVAGRGRLRTGS